MSRKRSGFAITSVRGGGGGGAGDAPAAAAAAPSPSSGGSRFRLVRFPSPGEVLRRGRWLCRDFYERDASPRGGGRVPVSLDAPRAGPAPHQPRSLGAFAELVQQVRGAGLGVGGAALATPTNPPTPIKPRFVRRRCPQNRPRHAQGRGQSSARGCDWLGRRARMRGEAGLPGRACPDWLVPGWGGRGLGRCKGGRGRGFPSPTPEKNGGRGRKAPPPPLGLTTPFFPSPPWV